MEEGKKYDAGKARMSLVPAGVINALLRVDRERQALDERPGNDYCATREVCDNLIDEDYENALYDCLALLYEETNGPLAGFDQILDILEFGAQKYGAHNWKLVTSAGLRYSDAAWRHLLAHSRGEERDPETGKPHAAHLGCNLVFLTWLKQEGKL